MSWRKGPGPLEPEKKPQISSGSLSASDTGHASPSPGVTLRGGADLSQEKNLWGRGLLSRGPYNTSSLTLVSFPSGHTKVNDFDFQQNSGSWASFLWHSVVSPPKNYWLSTKSPHKNFFLANQGKKNCQLQLPMELIRLLNLDIFNKTH